MILHSYYNGQTEGKRGTKVPSSTCLLGSVAAAVFFQQSSVREVGTTACCVRVAKFQVGLPLLLNSTSKEFYSSVKSCSLPGQFFVVASGHQRSQDLWLVYIPTTHAMRKLSRNSTSLRSLLVLLCLSHVSWVSCSCVLFFVSIGVCWQLADRGEVAGGRCFIWVGCLVRCLV